MFERLWQWIKSVNRKVWITAALVAVVFMVGMTWLVIQNQRNAFRPANWVGLSAQDRQTVSGNGGPAVMVGNWLYFVGNYVDASTLRHRQNEHNRVTYGAIYRVYIDPREGGPLQVDAERARTDPDFIPHLLDNVRQRHPVTNQYYRPFQLIVPKVAGFDQAALWVFDRYLIYTSPNNNRDRLGQLQLDRIDFFRVDLDGRNHQRIFTTSNEMLTTDNFTVASNGTRTFLLVHDGDNLRRIRVDGRNAGSVTTISRNVQTVAMPVVTSFHREHNDAGQIECRRFDVIESFRGVMSHVYFTEPFSEEDQRLGLRGNRVFQYNIWNGTTVEIRMYNHRVDMLALANGSLVYTARVEGGNSLGLFMTENIITDTSFAPFDITHIGDVDNQFRLLAPYLFQPEEVQGGVHLPTVVTRTIDDERAGGMRLPFRFVTIADQTMFIYERGSQEPIAIVENVGSIITITGSVVHFLSSAGDTRAVNLNNGIEIQGMTSIRPEINVRPWVIAGRNVPAEQLAWHFHIGTFTAGAPSVGEEDEEIRGDTTTMAMLNDLTNSNHRQFILGRLDHRFTSNNDDCC